MLLMPVLPTERLRVRPFTLGDFDAIYQILDVDFDSESTAAGDESTVRTDRLQWLRWTIASGEQLARLYQPPYGERAIERIADGVVVGSCGLVPALAPFGLLPNFPESNLPAASFAPEVGLFWALGMEHRGHGYATEAARAIIDYAFHTLHLGRIIATTEHDNAGSIGVMRRLGMWIGRNPHSEPPWFQVCGLLENTL